MKRIISHKVTKTQRAGAWIAGSPLQVPEGPAWALSGLSRQVNLVDIPFFAHFVNGFVSLRKGPLPNAAAQSE
jgi:hypothetical protein